MAWCRPVENDGATQHAATIAVFSQMRQGPAPLPKFWSGLRFDHRLAFPLRPSRCGFLPRSEEHTSELQSLMRISYAVFCLKKKKKKNRFESNIYVHNSKHKNNSTIQPIYTVITE